MTTYVMRKVRGKFKCIEISKAAPRGGAFVNGVIRDEMDPTRHMATNEYFTSKAKFRAATRAAGCIEVGNETATLLKPRRAMMPTREQRREAIRGALRRQLAGRPY